MALIGARDLDDNNQRLKALLGQWRTERDSNPRYLSVNTLSKRARSTTLPSVLFNETVVPLVGGLATVRATAKTAS